MWRGAKVAALVGGCGHTVATLFSSYYSPFLTAVEPGTRLSEAESERNATKKKRAIVSCVSLDCPLTYTRCMKARHVMQLYRGSVYDSCLGHYNAAACFEDPALSLSGVDEMKKVFAARKRLNPVQMSGEIEYSPQRIRIRLLQQVLLSFVFVKQF
jgi:hypothetical protein